MKELHGNLNTDLLKLIGIITMTIDHFGKVFYADEIWFQLIGRVTYPIFAYCLVIGFLRTKNVSKYFARLFIFSLISQPFYLWAFEYPWVDLNIFFTLLLGLFSIYSISQKQWLLVAFAHLIPIFLKVDYGIPGIILVDIIYVFRQKRTLAIILLIIHFASILFIDLTDIIRTLLLNQELVILPSPSLNVFGVLSIPILYTSINVHVEIRRSFFYLFYPGHLFILLIMKNFQRLLA